MQTLEISSWWGESAPLTQAAIPFISPFHLETLGRVTPAGPMDLVKSLAAAKKAQEAWVQTEASARSEIFDRIAQSIHLGKDEWAQTLAQAEGWSTSQALRFLLEPMEQLFRNLSLELRQAKPGEFMSPTGVVAVILPSVASFRVLGERMAPALAAGNAVVVKSTLRSPLGAWLWKQIFESARLPLGLVSLLFGNRQEIGDLLIRHPSVKAVSFAGQPESAVAVVSACAGMGKKLQVSGGAKNSLFVHAEADFQLMPSILEALVFGAGQLPWAASQIYVAQARFEEFQSHLISALNNLRPLNGIEEDSPWTPLAPAFDFAAWEKVRHQIATDQGKILVGGEKVGARHVRPLLTLDLTHCSTLQLEEVRGPLLVLNSVKYSHEMIKWTNTGDFGFAATLWGPEEKISRLGAKLDVGRVWLNSWWSDQAAFAGWKRSFFGISDFSAQGLFFSNVKKMT